MATKIIKPRAEKGTGTAISTDLKDHPTLLEKIRAAAKEDERDVSNYMRKRLVDLDRQGVLIPAPVTPSLFPSEK